MISFLEGRVAEKTGERVVLAVGGVGYEVAVPAQTLTRLPPPGRLARLFTRLHVRDDTMVLYGFAAAEERILADHLVTVSGVGTRMALAARSTPNSGGHRR